MKALVKAAPGPGLVLQDVPDPEVGPMDVLINVRKTSICGTGVHIWKWDAWAERTIPVPMAVGHEFCGVVESAGSGVTDIRPGELVSGEGHIVCNRCRNCLEMSGHPGALDDILEHSSNGAKVSLLGIFPDKVAIDWDKVIFKGLVLKGIYGREMFETWYKMSSMVRAGFDVTPVITHRYHYTEFESAFQTMLAGQCGKVVLDWTA